jgi:AcrR family transcriptional regulator
MEAMDTIDSTSVAAPTPARKPRPRSKESGGRDRILRAAGQLFVEQGYSATTTRQISSMVLIRQPSLYYHFPTKSAILLQLLLETTQPSLDKARELLASPGSPLTRLLQLIHFDTTLLAAGPSNTGSLYLLPEVNSDEFGEFRAIRHELAEVYATLLQQAVDAGEAEVKSVARTAALLFAMVEGVILRRADHPDLEVEATVADIEDATIRIVRADR